MTERRYLYGCYLLQATALLAVLIPFFRWNNLLEWDFPGHYNAIWYLKTYLFPWPTGWNPFFYCGYPQGMFYPPLAHYLAALLSFPMGIALAMKLLIATSLLLLPVTFYAFARRWGLDDLQGAVCSTWMTAALFLSGELFGTLGLGADLRSILNVGLFANALSLPVLFAFLATCGAVESHKSWKKSAFLLGTLFLLHPLSSLIAGLFVLAYALSQFWPPRAQVQNWKPLLFTVGIGLLLGAYWIFPFLTHRGYMNSGYTGAEWSPMIELVLLNGFILALTCGSKAGLRPLIFFQIAD